MRKMMPIFGSLRTPDPTTGVVMSEASIREEAETKIIAVVMMTTPAQTCAGRRWPRHCLAIAVNTMTVQRTSWYVETSQYIRPTFANAVPIKSNSAGTMSKKNKRIVRPEEEATTTWSSSSHSPLATSFSSGD